MQRLQSAHVIVTGGASGIGRAIATRFVAEDADVTVLDLPGALEDADASATGSIARACDVTDEVSVAEAIAAVLDRCGSIEVLVNCAGVVEKSEATETTLASWNRVLGVNLTGAFLTSREAGRSMQAAGHGSIINIASIDAHAGDAGELSYTASKAGLLGLTRGLAIELGPRGVRVNSVSPGLVVTPMTLQNSTRDLRARAVLDGRFERVPLRRGIRPEEIAATCVFLGSDDASGITGQDIIVDGGLLSDAYLVKALERQAASL